MNKFNRDILLKFSGYIFSFNELMCYFTNSFFITSLLAYKVRLKSNRTECVVWTMGKRRMSRLSSSNIISWEYMMIILAFCNCCIPTSVHAFVNTTFSVHSAMNTEEQISLTFSDQLLKILSQALEMLQQVYGSNTMSCTCFRVTQEVQRGFWRNKRWLQERETFNKQ